MKRMKDIIVNSQADKHLTRNQITNLNWEFLHQHTTLLSNTYMKVHLREKTVTYQEI